MNPDLVSIIMPCKNAGVFLSECINSIINQSYADWELIICNDHSKDNSLEIAQFYQKMDTRIYVVINSGMGILDALNTAYENSNGHLITRMDADDIMPKHKLETLVNLLTAKGSMNKVATGKVKYFPESKIKAGFKAYENWLNQLVDEQSHWEEIFKECVIASPCWMMDRTSFDKVGGFGNQYPEDYDLVWRMFMHETEVIVSKEILHLWRDHSDRTSRNSEIYQTQTFFDLKVNYMLQMPTFRNRQIVVWGAGRKGKSLANKLISRQKNILWVSNNPKKIGQNIYDIVLQDYLVIPENRSKLAILLTISSLDDQRDVYSFLHQKGYARSVDYYVLA